LAGITLKKLLKCKKGKKKWLTPWQKTKVKAKRSKQKAVPTSTFRSKAFLTLNF